VLKSIENALREHAMAHRRAETRSHLLEIIEATPDFVLSIDAEGHMLYCNRIARATLGIGETEDISNIHVADIYPMRERAQVLGEGIFSAVLDGVWSSETALVTRTGREIPVSQVIVAPLASDRRNGFVSIIARDITEIRLAEEVLAESGEFYRHIVEAANIGIWIIDPEDRITYANPKMAKMLACGMDEMIGKPAIAFMDEDGIALAEAHREAIRCGVEESHDIKLRRKNGTELWANLSTSPLFNDREQSIGTLALVTEITELKRRTEQAYQLSGLR
jgi:PAS domain S-box-containing protein